MLEKLEFEDEARCQGALIVCACHHALGGNPESYPQSRPFNHRLVPLSAPVKI
ncbi:protein kinase AMP-activated non-catalytic subunit gamma 2 [Homo sapiens]|uniref:Protein kinase AMP-activated non-catalytic subunit gamma 2 n=1 Tax=Homo sapiens TaxID=9606 RepID=F8WAY3_HUMAN|nr:protein kinase AMP-activated non-catalytic subunit gamma 2 [Homo sapiens]KAI4016485.1 protein kinase AMP-activated non-catalytic subunit gamma 2 [Homo sapiens]